jgi:hypothetical protein
MKRTLHSFWILAFLATAAAAQSQDRAAAQLSPQRIFHHHLADYDAELRRPDGHVDSDAMVKRLKQLGVNTYYWLVWHSATDWDDLHDFLPKAAKEGIEVWVYLVPPTESPPKFGRNYSEPFRLDYVRWAEEIAKLSLVHPNLTAWVIDDFYANHAFFSPAYLREIRKKSKAINPRLAFLPLMYFGEMRPRFVADYRDVIDGVVVAYLQDRAEIDRTWAILNDAPMSSAGEIAYPWSTPSHAGDYCVASQTAKVMPADRYQIQFSERDEFTGRTSGYHYKQFLVDGSVVWEEDVAGGTSAWQKVTVDVTKLVHGKANVTLAFRMLDKKGVGNFGVRWRISDLRSGSLQLAADLSKPEKWLVAQHGDFEAGFGTLAASAHQRRFHVPFISMTAADAGEFRLRHGDPVTPDRIAEQLHISLQAWHDGKCDGVVTYCLDKRPASTTFGAVQKQFRQFGGFDNK